MKQPVSEEKEKAAAFSQNTEGVHSKPSTETGHTPGPWRIEAGGGHAYNSIRGAESVQTNGWLKPIGGTSNASYSDRICENLGQLDLPAPAVNARLIVAAPDLLEACKRVLPDWVPDESDADGHICSEITNGDVRALLAAIAKAGQMSNESESLYPSPQPQVSKAQPSAETQPIVDLPSAETGGALRIVAAAIKQDGVIFTGTHHCFIIRDIVTMTGTKPVNGQQGFVTNTNRFVGRKEAGVIAIASGQIKALKFNASDLFSEELWDVAPPAQGVALTSSGDSKPTATSVPPKASPAPPPLPVDEEREEGEKHCAIAPTPTVMESPPEQTGCAKCEEHKQAVLDCVSLYNEHTTALGNALETIEERARDAATQICANIKAGFGVGLAELTQIIYRRFAPPLPVDEEHKEGKKTDHLYTDSLGFRLDVTVAVNGELPILGRHTTHADEHGKVLAESPHTIEIKKGIAPSRLVLVVAHEVYHLFYSIRHLITVDEEIESEVFGELTRQIYTIALQEHKSTQGSGVPTPQGPTDDGSKEGEISANSFGNEVADFARHHAGNWNLLASFTTSLFDKHSSSLRQRLHKVEEERDQLLANAKAQPTPGLQPEKVN